jgi:hypothetical protein
VTFKKAVLQTPNLETAWQPGLQALRAEDKPHIKVENPQNLSGSADIDTALQASEPEANRWDFAVGYQHRNRRNEVIYWIETHTGSDNQIKVVLKKLEWLKTWMSRDGNRLANFERDFVWVSSGHTLFTNGSRQVKKLAQKGLIYAGAILRILDQRRS